MSALFALLPSSSSSASAVPKQQPLFLRRSFCVSVTLGVIVLVALVEFALFSGSVHHSMRSDAQHRRLHPALRRAAAAASIESADQRRQHEQHYHIASSVGALTTRNAGGGGAARNARRQKLREIELRMLLSRYGKANRSFDEGRIHQFEDVNSGVQAGLRRRKKAPPPLSCAPRPLPAVPPFTRRHADVRPRYAVITMAATANGTADNSTQREILNRLQFVNKLEYCARHGYDFIMEGSDVVDRRRAPQWSKLRVLRKWLPLYSFVMWVDEDVLFTNFSHTIEDQVHTRLEEHQMRRFREAELAAQENGDPFEYKAEESIDMILTRDFNTWNTGVVFWRNSAWSNDFLRRMYTDVTPEQAAPFYDQGALLYLAAANVKPRGFNGRGGGGVGGGFVRDSEAAARDRAHMWVLENDNYFNAYPENLIHLERHMAYAWEQGDWAVHLASCKYFRECLQDAVWFFRESACRNRAHDLPVHLFAKHDEQQHMSRHAVRRSGSSSSGDNNSDAALAVRERKRRHREQVLAFLATHGDNATHLLPVDLVDWDPPERYIPPDSAHATLPPWEKIAGVADDFVFQFVATPSPPTADDAGEGAEANPQRVRPQKKGPVMIAAPDEGDADAAAELRRGMRHLPRDGILQGRVVVSRNAKVVDSEKQHSDVPAVAQRGIGETGGGGHRSLEEIAEQRRQQRHAGRHRRDIVESDGGSNNVNSILRRVESQRAAINRHSSDNKHASRPSLPPTTTTTEVPLDNGSDNAVAASAIDWREAERKKNIAPRPQPTRPTLRLGGEELVEDPALVRARRRREDEGHEGRGDAGHPGRPEDA